MIIEVSDLYDAFHLIAQTIWSTGEFQFMVADSRDRDKNKRDRKLNSIGVRFDELLDSLEYDFFFTGCARRIYKQTGKEIPLDEIALILHLHDASKNDLEGDVRKYHSHGFDWPQETEEENLVGSAIISGKLWPPEYRPQVRIFAHVDN